MKDFSEKELRKGLDNDEPEKTAEGLASCLKKLFADNQHKLIDEVVKELSFEELLGSLLDLEKMLIEKETEEIDFLDQFLEEMADLKYPEKIDPPTSGQTPVIG